MKPIGKYIVIKNIDEELKTESGLILSGEDMNKMRYKRGIVVEPGTDVKDIKSNDEVYYDKSHGFTMIIYEKQYTIITEKDIVVVL